MANPTGALNLSSTAAMVTSWSPYVTTTEADLLNTTENDMGAPSFGNVIAVDETNFPMIVYSFVDKVLIIVVMPIIFTIGVLGNSAVIIAFFRFLYMRTVTNHYLINLAVPAR